jgi:hypothetical protein
MSIGTAHYPDGSPVCEPGAHRHQPGQPGNPYVRDGRDERRAFLSARLAWLPTVKQPDLKPARGSMIRIDGVVAYRFELVPILDPITGEVVDAREDWVDVRGEAASAAQAALIEEAKAAVAAAAKKPKAAR